MKKQRLAGFAITVVLVAGSGAQASSMKASSDSSSNPVRKAILQARLDAMTTFIPGAVARVEDPGEFLWVGASGVSDLESDKPSKASNQFRAGSVTKTFAAVTTLKLAEQGRLHLDDTIEDHLPGLIPDGDRITIKHLLRHESGIADYLGFWFESSEDFEKRRLYVWKPLELIRPALDAEREFKPGEESSYSNTNYTLMALIIESVAGKPYENVVTDFVIEPLGLKDTYVTRRHEVGIRGEQHQTGYLPDDLGPVPFHNYANLIEFTDSSLSVAFGAGTLVSSVKDLSRFISALLEGELLSRKSLERMMEFVPQPYLGTSYGVDGGFSDRYGLGLMSFDEPCGQYVGHQGGTLDFVTLVARNPETGRTVAIAASTGPALPTQAAVVGFVRDAMCDQG